MKAKLNASLSRSIRNLCKKELIHAYSKSDPWKTWQSLKIAGIEVGTPLPRMNPEQYKGWKKGDFSLIEITDPNDRDLSFMVVQAVALTEKGKQLALMLTSQKT